MTPAEQAALAYQQQYARLRLQAIAQAVALWQLYGGVGDEDAESFIESVLPVILGAQRAVAALVAGYFQAVARQVTGELRPLRVDPNLISIEALRGTPAEEVYRRPVVAVRTALSQSKPFDEGMQNAEVRVKQLAEGDVISAQRAAAVMASIDDPRIVGYRRVLTGESCNLCQIASTQRYRVRSVERARTDIGRTGRIVRAPGGDGGLMPIHIRCDCAVAPIIGTADPGQVINRDLLERLRAEGAVDAISRQRARARKRERGFPIIREHGELGPVLVAAGDDFTSEDDIAA